MRLGAGSAANGKDYKSLKKHPFFAGVDWKNLHRMNPPLRFKNTDKKNSTP
jgi:hypothetical protein